MLNKYIDSRTPAKEKKYMLFLSYMIDALGYTEANSLFKKAKKDDKYIKLTTVKGRVDGEKYQLTDKIR